MAKRDNDKDLNSEEKKSPERRRKRKKSSKTRDYAAQLVKSALQDHLEHVAIKRMQEEKDINMLSCIIEEYLENFIILGYDYKGDPVQFISAHNQQQADALGTSLIVF